MEGLEYAKDGVILLIGGGAAWKVLSTLVSKLTSGNKNAQSVTVNAGNTNGGNSGSNGRVYATKDELSKHALNCAGGIHEKINQNYEKLSTQINSNHTESMKTFADLKVSMARLESMRRGGKD